MLLANARIRTALSSCAVHQWQLADALCIHETALSRKLRHELPPDEQERLVALITQIAEHREEADN